MTGRPDDPNVPSYLPPWPTEWPNTPAEAAKVVAGMRPGPSTRTIAIAITCVTVPAAIVALLAPQALAFLAILLAIAIGAAGARMKQPSTPTERRPR